MSLQIEPQSPPWLTAGPAAKEKQGGSSRGKGGGGGGSGIRATPPMPPVGFGSNLPASRERQRSRGEQEGSSSDLNLGVTSTKLLPSSSQRATRSPAGSLGSMEGSRVTTENVRARRAEEEAARVHHLHEVKLQPSQIRLGTERSRHSAFKLESDGEDSSPRGGGSPQNRPNYGSSPPTWGRQTKANQLAPPPVPPPTVGQLKRAKAAELPPPSSAHTTQRGLTGARPQSSRAMDAVVMKPAFEVPAAQPMSVMDGFLMLRSASAELPEEVETLDLSGRSLYRVEEADLVHFTKLRHLNVSDNLLPSLLALSFLPNLTYLHASANGLASLGIGSALFARLLELDVSFNSLSAAAAFEQLADLPSLKKLDLSGNSMPRLPERLHGFTALEELTLAANGLKGSCLGSLQALPALRRVDLSDNVITHIPPWRSSDPLPRLSQLILTNNHISLASALLPLEELPSLTRVVLAGNPLSRKASLAAKRAARAKEAEYRAAGLSALKSDAEQAMENAVAPTTSGDARPLALPAPPTSYSIDVASAASPSPPPQAQIRVELNTPQLKPPSLGKTMAAAVAPPIVDETAKPLPDPNNKYQGLTGMLRESDVSHGAVMEAFGRLDSEIRAWEVHAEEVGYGLDPVAEGREEAEEAVEEEYSDNTFLTGLMMDGGGGAEDESTGTGREEEGSTKKGGEASGEAGGGGGEGERSTEGALDPTVALALSLGLDPSLLSINSGHLGGDCAAAIKALRFALAHPLVGEDEGLRPKPNHFKSTATVRAKQRERHIAQLPSLPAAPALPALDFKATKIASIEDILAGMKGRLAQVEASLVQQLGEESAADVAYTPGPRSPQRTTPPVGNSSARMSPPGSRGQQLSDRALKPGSPLRPRASADTPPSRLGTAAAASNALGYS